MSMCPQVSHFSQASAGISSRSRCDVRGLRSFLNHAITAIEKQVERGRGQLPKKPLQFQPTPTSALGLDLQTLVRHQYSPTISSPAPPGEQGPDRASK